MDFAARSEILNNDDEWTNIPPLMRDLFRGLNEELKNNQRDCNNLCRSQRELENRLRDFSSRHEESEQDLRERQMEFQEECSKDCRNVSEKLRDIHKQVHHMNSENENVGNRFQEIKSEVGELFTMCEEMRERMTSLSKTTRNSFSELEKNFCSKLEEFSDKFEKLHGVVDSISGRQNDLMEMKKEFESPRIEFRRLRAELMEEIERQATYVRQHENALDEMKIFRIKTEQQKEEAKGTCMCLQGQMDHAMTIVKRLETSSHKRFEILSSALEKLYTLVERYSQIHSQRESDNSSLMKLLKENRKTLTDFMAELGASLYGHSSQNRSDLECLNRRMDALHYSKDEVDEIVSEKCEKCTSHTGKIIERLTALESKISQVKSLPDIELHVSELLKNERELHEAKFIEFSASISNEMTTLQGQMKDVKRSIETLDNNMGENKHVGDDVLTVEKRVRESEIAIKDMRKLIDDVKNTHARFAAISPTDFADIKTRVESVKTYMDSEKKSHQNYESEIDSMKENISTVLSDLKKSEKRIAMLEANNETSERKKKKPRRGGTEENRSPSLTPQENSTRETSGGNEVIQLAQSQINSMDAKLGKLQSFCEALENKVQNLSREVEDASEAVRVEGEKRELKDKRQKGMEHVSEEPREHPDLQYYKERTRSIEDSIRSLKFELGRLEETFERYSNITFSMKKSVDSCVAADSDVWRKMRTDVEWLLTRCLEDRVEKLEEKCKRFVTSEIVDNIERKLTLIQGEQKEFKHFMQQTEKKTHVEKGGQQGCVDVNEPISGVENRVVKFAEEEDFEKTSSHIMGLHMKEMISSLRTRVESMVSEMLENVLPSTHSLPSDELMGKLREVEERMDTMMDCILKLQEISSRKQGTSSEPAWGPMSFELSNHIIKLESSLEEYKHRLEKNSEDISSQQKQLYEMKERPVMDMLANVTARISAVECAVEEMEQSRFNEKGNTSCQLTGKSWKADLGFLKAEFMGLLSKKVDRQYVDNKLGERETTIKEQVEAQLESLKQELMTAIEDRVHIDQVENFFPKYAREDEAHGGKTGTAGAANYGNTFGSL